VPQALFIRNAYLFYGKEHYPDIHMYLRLRTASLKWELRKSLRGTKLVFCQTPVVKERFCRSYGYPPEQVEILGFPPPAEIVNAAEREPPTVLAEKGDRFYVLVLASYMPHRNPSVLIPLCRKYAPQLRNARVRFITTVEPTDHPKAPAYLREVSALGFDDIITNVGRIDRDRLVDYLVNSDVFWSPTLLECLSTAHLEALASGAAVMAPDLDFARYTCGEAAVYYNPWDVDSIFEKLMILRNDEALCRNLAETAKVHLQDRQKFPQNWQEVAAVTLEKLRELATS